MLDVRRSKLYGGALGLSSDTAFSQGAGIYLITRLGLRIGGETQPTTRHARYPVVSANFHLMEEEWMSQVENRAVVERMVDAINRGDADIYAACHTEDVVIRILSSGGTMHGRAAARQWIADFFDSYEGARSDIVALHPSGDAVVVLEVMACGRQRRHAGGSPAGTELNNPEAFVYRIRDGLIAEVRAYV
jgi:ketosteroid isomerase-like protein